MLPSGVVDALHRIHRALRPGGTLLDIHPEPAPTRIEVHQADRITELGYVDTSVSIAKILAARALLDSVVEAGYFAPARNITFEFRYRFDSVEAWLDYMSKRWSDATISPAIVSRARRLLRRVTGNLMIHQHIRATRLERQIAQLQPRAQ